MATESNTHTHRPIVVFMSGAPGSGKSHLAAKLAARTGLFHVERDKLKHAIEYTAGERGDRSKTIIPTYFESIRQLAIAGVSQIADGVLYRDKATSQLVPVAAAANVVVIHCQSADSDSRFFERERRTHATDTAWELAYAEHLKWVKSMSQEPLSLPYPTLIVRTDGRYKPSFAEIANWVHAHSNAALPNPDYTADRGRVG